VAFQGPKATSKSRMFIWASGFHNLEAGLKSESNSVTFARTREFRLTCSHAVKRLLCAKAPCSIRCYVLGPVSLWNSPCALKSRNLGSFMQSGLGVPTSPPFPNGRHRSQSCRRQSPSELLRSRHRSIHNSESCRRRQRRSQMPPPAPFPSQVLLRRRCSRPRIAMPRPMPWPHL
jgi:hypothetical protein